MPSAGWAKRSTSPKTWAAWLRRPRLRASDGLFIGLVLLGCSIGAPRVAAKHFAGALIEKLPIPVARTDADRQVAVLLGEPDVQTEAAVQSPRPEMVSGNLAGGEIQHVHPQCFQFGRRDRLVAHQGQALVRGRLTHQGELMPDGQHALIAGADGTPPLRALGPSHHGFSGFSIGIPDEVRALPWPAGLFHPEPFWRQTPWSHSSLAALGVMEAFHERGQPDGLHHGLHAITLTILLPTVLGLPDQEILVSPKHVVDDAPLTRPGRPARWQWRGRGLHRRLCRLLRRRAAIAGTSLGWRRFRPGLHGGRLLHRRGQGGRGRGRLRSGRLRLRRSRAGPR